MRRRRGSRGGNAWHGAAVVAAVNKAAQAAVNETLAECVIYAKNNHPGWVNRSTNAEGSIRLTQFATQRGATITGAWGSVGVAYFAYLEFLHGRALQNAADVLYPTLAGRIQRRLG